MYHYNRNNPFLFEIRHYLPIEAKVTSARLICIVREWAFSLASEAGLGFHPPGPLVKGEYLVQGFWGVAPPTFRLGGCQVTLEDLYPILNSTPHLIQLMKHLSIGKSQNTVACLLKCFLPYSILLFAPLIFMCPTVYFYN